MQARSSSLRRIALRTAVIAGSLAAIFGALIVADVTHALWLATLAAVAAFYFFAHATPSAVFRLQSMPYTYQLHNNWGPRAFELQNVTYAAYHTHWYNHATHAAFPLEAWLWLVAVAHWGGPAASVLACAALSAQAVSFGERRFAFALCAFWLALSAAAVYASAALGPRAYQLAQLALVALGFWRFTGHWVEPLPPGVLGNRAFVPLSEAAIDARILRPMALGYLSEFSAGLPFRLVNSWLFRLAQRLGYRPERSLDTQTASEVAATIHREGWSVQPTTREIVFAARELPT
jgi:hypothetical protein